MAEVSFGNGQVTLSRNLSAATNRDQDGSYFFSSKRNPEKAVKSQLIVTLQCHQEYYASSFAAIKIPYGPSRLQSYLHFCQKVEGG